MDNRKRPEWVPEEGGSEYASEVMPGVKGGHDGMPGVSLAPDLKRAKPAELSTEDFVRGVQEGNRTILARAITLIESNAPQHISQAQEVLQALLPQTGNSIRVGITGVPGAGKSSLIETLGVKLCSLGHKVAVLAVDPSSTRSGGSILGDKTRMERLSREENAFIRPSPSGGMLGGVARKTRETMLVCEAAGYDVLLIETVGVGQGEVLVRSMVDFFLLVMIAGAGDELQGIKKGVIELADLLVINKADGENEHRAEAAANEYSGVLRFLQPATEGWKTRAFTVSALTGRGVDGLWNCVEEFVKAGRGSGSFVRRRREQSVEWMGSMVESELRRLFYQNPAVNSVLEEFQARVVKGELPATAAVQELLRRFRGE